MIRTGGVDGNKKNVDGEDGNKSTVDLVLVTFDKPF